MSSTAAHHLSTHLSGSVSLSAASLVNQSAMRPALSSSTVQFSALAMIFSRFSDDTCTPARSVVGVMWRVIHPWLTGKI
jgi:hypothetical protein